MDRQIHPLESYAIRNNRAQRSPVFFRFQQQHTHLKILASGSCAIFSLKTLKVGTANHGPMTASTNLISCVESSHTGNSGNFSLTT